MNELHIYSFGGRGISPFDIVATDVTEDFSSEIVDGGKDASSNDLPLNFGEPDFDLVKPGRVGGCKMNAHLRMIGQKVVDEFGFMGREISAMTWISRPRGWEAPHVGELYCEAAMNGKISHDEFCARGGRSRSPAKTAAVLRNLELAKKALNAKRRALNAEKPRVAP